MHKITWFHKIISGSQILLIFHSYHNNDNCVVRTRYLLSKDNNFYTASLSCIMTNYNCDHGNCFLSLFFFSELICSHWIIILIMGKISADITRYITREIANVCCLPRETINIILKIKLRVMVSKCCVSERAENNFTYYHLNGKQAEP